MTEAAQEVDTGPARIEAILEEIESLPDLRCRALMTECLEAVLSLHGAALDRMLGIVADADAREQPALQRILGDPEVLGVLLIHGLHPEPVERRLQQALDQVLPFIHSHGGDIEIVDIRDGVVRLRMQGACDGCPSSSLTLEHSVKRAIAEGCPDIVSVEVEGVATAAPGRSALQCMS